MAALARRAPGALAMFARHGWRPPASIDRVYVSDRACAHLGYAPRYGLDQIAR